MSNASIYSGQTTLIPVVNAFGNVFEEWQIATAGQTIFILASFQYTPGTNTLLVFKNGLFQRPGSDYVETNATRITFTVPTLVGDRIAFFAFATSGVAIPNGGGVPAGGTTGQALVKIDNSDYNSQWVSLTALASLLDAPRQNVASATTVNLTGLSAVTRNIAITGNTNITGFQVANGQLFAVTFNGTLTLTNSASLVTNRSANINVLPGDTCFVRAIADNTVEIISYVGGSTLTSAFNYTFRNKVDNGDFVINARGSGVVSTSASYPVDRFTFNFAAGTVSAQQLASTIPGFYRMLRVSSGAINTAVANSYWAMSHTIEGFNSQELLWGTANAKPITISFWSKASVVGTYSVSVQNGGAARAYVATFTHNVANVAEYKQITIPGDVTGTWAIDNTKGMQINICYGVGTTFATAAGAWTAGNFLGATGQTNIMATNGATFDIAGLQVEAGSLATAFEYLPVEVNFTRCQRYFEAGGWALAGYTTAAASNSFTINFKLTKRIGATVVLTQGATSNCGAMALNVADSGSQTIITVGTALGSFSNVGTWTASADL